MSRRDKLCLVGIALLFLIGAPWAFGLFDPERWRAPIDFPAVNQPAPAREEPAPSSSQVALRLQVVDALSKAPLRATVEVEAFNNGVYESAAKDRQFSNHGAFEFHATGGGGYRARVACDGYVPRQLAPRRARDGEVLDFGVVALEPLFNARLVPLTADGKPFKCSLELHRVSPLPTPEYPLPQPTITREDDGFLCNLTGGKWLAIFDSTFVMSASFVFEVGPKSLSHSFSIPPRPPTGKGGLDLRVVDSDGVEEKQPAFYIEAIGFPFRFRGKGFEYALTERPFELRQLPAGRYRVTARCTRRVALRDMRTWLYELSKVVEITDIDSVTPVEFRLPRPSSVSVRVTAHGKPVKGASLTIGGVPSFSRGYPHLVTDEQGRASVSDMAPGGGHLFQLPWSSFLEGEEFVACFPLLAEHFTQAHRPFCFETKGDDSAHRELELYPPQCAAVHLKLAINGQRPGGPIEIWDERRMLAGIGTSDDGTVTLLGLPPGRYRLKMSTDYGGKRSADCWASLSVLHPGRHEYSLNARTYAIRGAAAWAEPGSVQRNVASMRALLTTGTGAVLESSDVRGRSFEFQNVAPGRYEVAIEAVTRDGLGPFTFRQPVTVTDGDVTTSVFLPEQRFHFERGSVRVEPRYAGDWVKPLSTEIKAVVTFEDGRLYGSEQTAWNSARPDSFVVRVPVGEKCVIVLSGSRIVTQRIEHVLAPSNGETVTIQTELQQASVPVVLEIDTAGITPAELAHAACLYSGDSDEESFGRGLAPLDVGGGPGFLFSDELPGLHRYLIRCRGFEPQQVAVRVEAGKPVRLRVKLRRSAP